MGHCSAEIPTIAQRRHRWANKTLKLLHAEVRPHLGTHCERGKHVTVLFAVVGSGSKASRSRRDERPGDRRQRCPIPIRATTVAARVRHLKPRLPYPFWPACLGQAASSWKQASGVQTVKSSKSLGEPKSTIQAPLAENQGARPTQKASALLPNRTPSQASTCLIDVRKYPHVRVAVMLPRLESNPCSAGGATLFLDTPYCPLASARQNDAQRKEACLETTAIASEDSTAANPLTTSEAEWHWTRSSGASSARLSGLPRTRENVLPAHRRSPPSSTTNVESPQHDEGMVQTAAGSRQDGPQGVRQQLMDKCIRVREVTPEDDWAARCKRNKRRGLLFRCRTRRSARRRGLAIS